MGNLLAEHPESYRHDEGLETSQAVNVFNFECRNRVGDGCVRNVHAVKDSNDLELMEIISLAFFLLGSPPRNRTKLLFSTLKRREDLRHKGYFVEGKSFLHERFGCWEERDRRSSQQWILQWDITPASFIIIVIRGSRANLVELVSTWDLNFWPCSRLTLFPQGLQLKLQDRLF